MKLVSALWLCASFFAAIASVIWFASGHIVAGIVWAVVAVMDGIMVGLVDGP